MKLAAVIFDLDSVINDNELVSGFEEFASDLKDSGAQIALVSGNIWEEVDKILGDLELQEFFGDVTTIEEATFSLPDPDLFIVSSDKLAVGREGCLVITNSATGITAAHRVGMKVIAILSGDDEIDETLDDADLVVEGFSEITPKAIEEL